MSPRHDSHSLNKLPLVGNRGLWHEYSSWPLMEEVVRMIFWEVGSQQVPWSRWNGCYFLGTVNPDPTVSINASTLRLRGSISYSLKIPWNRVSHPSWAFFNPIKILKPLTIRTSKRHVMHMYFFSKYDGTHRWGPIKLTRVTT